MQACRPRLHPRVRSRAAAARSRVAALAVSLWLAAAPEGQAAPGPERLSLDRAVAIAFERSPTLKAARAAVAVSSGRLVGAKVRPFNPQVSLEGGARIGPSRTAPDIGIGLSQQIQIGGQRDKRIAVAHAGIRAARARLLRRQRLLAAAVHLAFINALATRDTLAVAEAEAKLAAELLYLTQRRLRAGAGTQLDVNVAAAELGRTEVAVSGALGSYMVARAALGEAIGAPGGALPIPEGTLRSDLPPPPPLSELLDRAEQQRADLIALKEAERRARARLELARAAATPNLSVGVFGRIEDGQETILGGGVGIGLPLNNRNQGGVAIARAAIEGARARRSVARLSVRRQITAAWHRHAAARRSVLALRKRIIGTTEKNIALLRKAFDAGKSTWIEVLVMRRSLFDSRRALVLASARKRRARVTIDIAAGQMPVPTASQPVPTAPKKESKR